MSRWIALHCGEDVDALQENYPNAFLLLCQIARRARWKDCLITGMREGEAFIGDWKTAGLPSRKAYEVAKERLTKCGLVSFKGGNKGTVATLLNTTIFSISNDVKGEQEEQPRGNQGASKGNPGGTNHTDTQKTQTQNPPNPQGGTDGKSRKLPTTPEAIAISELYRRKPTTGWSSKEVRAFKNLTPIDADDLALVIRYTACEQAKGSDGKHRRDLQTFLNNFRGEVDRARAWHTAPSGDSVENMGMS